MNRSINIVKYTLIGVVFMVIIIGVTWSAKFSPSRPPMNETTVRMDVAQRHEEIFRGYITALTVEKFCTANEFMAKYPEAISNKSHVIYRGIAYPVIEEKLENGTIIRYVPVFCKSETQYYFTDIDRNRQYVLDLSKALLRLRKPLQSVVGTTYMVYINGTLKDGVLYALVVYD